MEIEKFLKKVAIVFFIVFMIFFIIFGINFFDVFTNKEPFDFKKFKLMFFIFGVLVVMMTIVVVICFNNKIKNYRTNLIKNKQPNNFEYLDTFYFFVQSSNGDTVSSECFEYNILKCIDNGKIYAINSQDTNTKLNVIKNKAELLKINNMNKISFSKDWSLVEIGAKGTLWIGEELTNFYRIDNDNANFGKFGKINVHKELYNINKEYDYTLLNNVTFVNGYAEFK